MRAGTGGIQVTHSLIHSVCCVQLQGAESAADGRGRRIAATANRESVLGVVPPVCSPPRTALAALQAAAMAATPARAAKMASTRGTPRRRERADTRGCCCRAPACWPGGAARSRAAVPSSATRDRVLALGPPALPSSSPRLLPPPLPPPPLPPLLPPPLSARAGCRCDRAAAATTALRRTLPAAERLMRAEGGWEKGTRVGGDVEASGRAQGGGAAASRCSGRT